MSGANQQPRDGTGHDLTERLLHRREAQGLLWTARARLGYLGLGAIVALVTTARLQELLITEGIIAVGVGISWWIARQARARRMLSHSGWLGVGFDIVATWIMPFAWFHGLPDDTPTAFLLKVEIIGVVVVLAALNTLALRPQYPLAIATMGALQRALFLTLALMDPETRTTWDPVATHLHGAVNIGFVVWEAVSLGVLGALLWFVSRWVRQTVHTAVEAEAHNGLLREQQAELVADAKLASLGQLVAGVTHELNTPLGAVRSSFDSVRRAADKLATALSEGDQLMTQAPVGIARVNSAMRTAVDAGEAGLVRVADVLASLRDFSRLDAAQAAPVDLHKGLDATVSLLPPHLLDGVALIRDYADLPPVPCRAADINQVFHTVLTNALEAVDGQGEVFIRTRAKANRVVVEIEDTGKGIEAARLETLFDLSLGDRGPAATGTGGVRGARVGLRFGLPIARRVVRQHGGSIQVQSDVGRGTTIVVSLPT